MFKGLRTVIYHVSDIGKAKKWYAVVLGTEPYFDQPYYVGFDVGGFELGLDPDQTGVSVGNNVLAYWKVDDIQEAFGRLLELGARKNSDIQNVGNDIRVVTVTDPFGNVFGVIQEPQAAMK
jgi:predicted enzyme related to lactoylglutathione lyase